MYREIVLDDSLLDINAWLPNEEINKLAEAIVEANTILNKQPCLGTGVKRTLSLVREN